MISHSVLWSQCVPIPAISNLSNPSREVTAKDISRVISNTSESPSTSHSNVPSLTNSMSPVTLPDYKSDSAKIVSSARVKRYMKRKFASRPCDSSNTSSLPSNYLANTGGEGAWNQ